MDVVCTNMCVVHILRKTHTIVSRYLHLVLGILASRIIAIGKGRHMLVRGRLMGVLQRPLSSIARLPPFDPLTDTALASCSGRPLARHPLPLDPSVIVSVTSYHLFGNSSGFDDSQINLALRLAPSFLSFALRSRHTAQDRLVPQRLFALAFALTTDTPAHARMRPHRQAVSQTHPISSAPRPSCVGKQRGGGLM